uniref:microtubule organization protein AKNA-like n=1 Tax=Pristiophorus japonicus TaxID=55135 RepID=UPI00398E5B69
MEYFEADINLDATNELDTDDNEDLLEKMDDYQFTRFVENHCINLRQSHDILDEEWIKQGSENSLVWEKSFEHSILLDVDDNFNLNFSEVCDSYTICLSQLSAEDADDIGNIENEYDGSDEDEILTTKETQYEHNQDIHSSSYSDKHDETKDNLESSFQEYKLQDIAGNTTDEEQEELPYDDNLQNLSEHHTDENPDLVDHMSPLSRLVTNQSDYVPDSGMTQTIPFRDQRSIVENAIFQKEVPDNELSTEAEASSHKSKSELNTILSEDMTAILVSKHGTKLENGFPVEHNQLSAGRSSIAESLLRYFSEEDLALSSSMYIDSETLPETSFTDSIEETVIKNHISSIASNDLLININTFTSEADLSRKQEIDDKFANEEKVIQDENDSSYSGPAQGNVENNGTYKKKTSWGPETPPKIIQEENAQAPLSLKTISGITQTPMLKMGRTISYNEIKYGKGKQHYPLPDFSKVAPKVKIPKRNTSNNYNLPRSRIKKTKSSPNSSENPHAIYKSAIDVVQEVLDSTQPAVIPTRTEFNNKRQYVEANHSPELFQQLQRSPFQARPSRRRFEKTSGERPLVCAGVQRQKKSSRPLPPEIHPSGPPLQQEKRPPCGSRSYLNVPGPGSAPPPLVRHYAEPEDVLRSSENHKEDFDKLLIKYAEAENTIDQLRFGAKVSVPSDSSKSSQMIQCGIWSSPCQITTLTVPQPHRAQSGFTSDSDIVFPLESTYNNCPMSLSVTSAGNKSASCPPIAEAYKTTEAGQMVQKLNKHIEYFKHQVEDFHKCLNSRSISEEVKQWEFKELRDGQDKLERSYIATKDEHRSLQQRRYLGKNITVGEFDPDREIEGKIFRIGMQLENIKEKIDEDICNQSSTHNSIVMSTPLSTHESLSSGHAVYSESPMAAITQEGLRVGLDAGSLSDESVATQDIFQMEVMPEENSKSPLLENRYNHIPQSSPPVQFPDRDLNKCSKIPALAADFLAPEDKPTSRYWVPVASIHTLEDKGCRTISEPVENINENQIKQDLQTLELQISILPTKAPPILIENNLHSSVYPSDLSMNKTLELHSTSFQGQESLNELKQKILSPDSGIAGSEGSRPTTATQTLDSELPQTERYSSFSESMSSFMTRCHKANKESSSHTNENIIEEGNNKVRQLLQLADPSGCTNPFNRLEPIFGAAQQGNAFLELDFLAESSDGHIPLPIPRQCTPKTFQQQTNCGTKENEVLSQSWSTRNEEILQLQYEVSQLKQKLEESLSKLSNEPKTKEVSGSPSQEQRYRARSCRRKKTSSTSRSAEDVKLTTNSLNGHKRRHCTWLRADDDASDRELSSEMEELLFSDTQKSVRRKQSFLETPRTSHHRRSYSEGHELKDSHKGLYSSPNGQNLHRRRMRTCFLCSENAPCELFSARSSRQSRRGLTSCVGISSTVANKYTGMLASISPIRYDTIEYPPISSVSRIYYSPSYEIVKIGSQHLPNQTNNIDKSTSNPQISHLNTTLDRAIEAANSMKKTTRRMVKTLSTDLAKAEYYKYLYDF